MDYYIGQIGIAPEKFWTYTFKENYLLAESFHIKNNLNWEQTRYISCMIYNMNISKKSQAKKPIDLFKLPQDKKGKKHSHKEMMEFRKQVEKSQSEGKFKELK